MVITSLPLRLYRHVSGPPHKFTDRVVTAASLYALFIDYITYEEDALKFIFAVGIVQKCINLSNDNWRVLTLPINDLLFDWSECYNHGTKY